MSAAPAPGDVGLLYGTAWKREATAALVRSALEHGFRAFDTACQPRHYDEPGVGAGLALGLSPKLRRAELYLQSKFTPLDAQDPARLPYDPAAPLPQQVRQSADASLRHLRTEYLDCLLLHSPYPDARDTLQAWGAMERLVQEGRVRHLGLSNCTLPELEALCATAGIQPAVVQNRFQAPGDYDRALRHWCRAHHVVYQSFWTLTANPQLLARRALRDIARRRARTPAQVLFRFLTQIGVVPLTGTRSVRHMREDLAIFEFELTAHECEAMDALLLPMPQ